MHLEMISVKNWNDTIRPFGYIHLTSTGNTRLYWQSKNAHAEWITWEYLYNTASLITIGRGLSRDRYRGAISVKILTRLLMSFILVEQIQNSTQILFSSISLQRLQVNSHIWPFYHCLGKRYSRFACLCNDMERFFCPFFTGNPSLIICSSWWLYAIYLPSTSTTNRPMRLWGKSLSNHSKTPIAQIAPLSFQAALEHKPNKWGWVSCTLRWSWVVTSMFA